MQRRDVTRLIAVAAFSPRIGQREWVALLGQSGSGKSTISRCLIGLTPPTSGEIRCRGRPHRGVHPEAFLVFQTIALFYWLAIEQNIACHCLRQEMRSLWHRKDNSLRSVFMVTRNIEEAVETAARIDVLFPNPGRLGLVLENPLPYPRDPQSPEFKKLVATIYESITRQCLPDAPRSNRAACTRRPLPRGQNPRFRQFHRCHRGRF